MPKARYIMVGGFLGAGKTTALLRLARRFRDRGQSVGLITNDQSVGLVDTAMAAAHGFPVKEITGGCFCCKFASLTDAAEALAASDRPDVFLAEPVGSCTDLAATVAYPLRRLYGDSYRIAPYTVLVDPGRAERILGLSPGNAFSPKVVYIYLKQLEEADIIAVNKADTLDPARQEKLIATLKANFRTATILPLSARRGDGFDAWADTLDAAPGTGDAMLVDYDVYAEGEALLGWVNLTATLSSSDPFDGNGFARTLIRRTRDALTIAGVEVAHLKATVSPDSGNDLAVVNLVSTAAEPEQSHSLQDRLDAGELIVNLRAEADPGLLLDHLKESLAATAGETGVAADVTHAEAFRPGRPVPTHRDARGIA